MKYLNQVKTFTQTSIYARYLYRSFVIAFIILNLVTIIHSNRPNWFPLQSKNSWRLSIYAHCVGLDNRWEMFSYTYRNDWKLIFKAKYRDDDTEFVLPTALQTERRFIDEWFFDFREAKIRLNMYSNRKARRAYASFLARQFPSRNGKPIEYVTCDLVYQAILPQEEALTSGYHLSPAKFSQRFDKVYVP